jgi:hypothetical protein
MFRESSAHRPERDRRSRGNCYRNVWFYPGRRKDRCALVFPLMQPLIISQICIPPVRIDGRRIICLNSQLSTNNPQLFGLNLVDAPLPRCMAVRQHRPAKLERLQL